MINLSNEFLKYKIKNNSEKQTLVTIDCTGGRKEYIINHVLDLLVY